MKIVIFTKYSSLAASSRLRTYQYLPYFKAQGYDFEIYPLFDGHYLTNYYKKGNKSKLSIITQYVKRICLLKKMINADVVIIEKELFPWLPYIFESFMALFKIKYIVDYDDAIFHNYDQNGKVICFFLSTKINSVMKNSAACICGNTYLQNKAVLSGAGFTKVIPTVIDINRYDKKNYYTIEHKIKVGWIGSPSTAVYLNEISDVLKILAKRYDFTLVIVGAEFECEGVNVECHAWSEDNEVNLIKSFDVGIMPLKDSPWEKGKCGYKLIQYMACAVPVIGSDIGVNREIINNSNSGYVVNGNESWINAFESLFKSKELRQKLGGNGREAVIEKYTVQSQAKEYIDILNRIRSS